MQQGLGLILIEICDYNLLSGEDLADIAEHPEVAVMSYDCLTVCGMCSLRPFAIVNGRRIFGKNKAECLTKIKQAVKDELRRLA
ncbi:MAG: YuzB family protein [Sporolactobacillus sp.]|nr:YuzB family protein [Sporolactobacillus sp.]MCI1882621.1 YuzB family protein [Sporolactobacillus sp.]